MMPAFIQRSDDPQIPPPYDLTGVKVRSFELAADMGALTNLCNSLLNIGTLSQRRFQYRPVLPYVALEVLTYDRMTSTVPPFSGYGYITQQEIYFRLLVCRYDLVGPFLVPARLCNFFPFIVVDNVWSAISGREVLGIPKVIGSIDQHSAADTSYSAGLSLPLFKTYSVTTEQHQKPVLSIQTGRTVGGPKSGLPWPWVIFEELSSELSPPQLLWSEMIDPLGFSIVQLKQFRDAEIATEACFQGLVTAEFSVTTASNYTVFGSAEINLFPAASIDLASCFGLTSTNPLQAALAYELSCDMTLGNTRNEFIPP